MNSETEQTDWDQFLREAIQVNDTDLIRGALAQGADPNVDVYGDGHTALFWAVSAGNVEEAKLLLEAGARVAREQDADSTSLHAAAEDGDLRLVSLLFEYDGKVALDWFDYLDRTPLMWAVVRGDMKMARVLLDAGADVNAHNEPHIGDTSLHLVAANGTSEMASLLLDAGADPEISGWMGLTPLDKARRRKREEGQQVCALLERARGKRATPPTASSFPPH